MYHCCCVGCFFCFVSSYIELGIKKIHKAYCCVKYIITDDQSQISTSFLQFGFALTREFAGLSVLVNV